MTLRNKIANVVSGGAITKWQDKFICTERFLSEAQQSLAIARQRNEESRAELEIAKYHLIHIAAQETPGANATVRRMARMAREGLGK